MLAESLCHTAFRGIFTMCQAPPLISLRPWVSWILARGWLATREDISVTMLIHAQSKPHTQSMSVSASASASPCVVISLACTPPPHPALWYPLWCPHSDWLSPRNLALTSGPLTEADYCYCLFLVVEFPLDRLHQTLIGCRNLEAINPYPLFTKKFDGAVLCRGSWSEFGQLMTAVEGSM